MHGETEYTENMKNHELAGRGKEPKLSQIKEKVKPFEGNYSSVYQDYGSEPRGDGKGNSRACCTVTPQEREAMVIDSVERIMQDPKLAKQVFN